MDNVTHPSHYEGTYGIECIAAIQNALTPEEFRGYCKGCAMKYLWREQGKGEVEDLKKAHMYLDFLIMGQPDECTKDKNDKRCNQCIYCISCSKVSGWCDYYDAPIDPSARLLSCARFKIKSNDQEEEHN